MFSELHTLVGSGPTSRATRAFTSKGQRKTTDQTVSTARLLFEIFTDNVQSSTPQRRCSVTPLVNPLQITADNVTVMFTECDFHFTNSKTKKSGRRYWGAADILLPAAVVN